MSHINSVQPGTTQFPEIAITSPVAAEKKVLPIPSCHTPSPSVSSFRRIFQSSDQMKAEFGKFLKTIFYQLDEKKTFALLEEILNDPEKTDEQIYAELLSKIHTAKKGVPILSKLWSLYVLKTGMGKQAAELMKDFKKGAFHDYMEIYDRRYANTMRAAVKLPLDGNVIAVCDNPEVAVTDKIQAGALFSRYPYTLNVSLNDSDCLNPLLQPEKTHRPIGDEVADNSLDMISCLGGLHHVPPERVNDFAESLNKKLRPGGVILFRDHDVTDRQGSANLQQEDLRAIASVVHSFVNAADGVSAEVEQKEIREFKSLEDWVHLMQKHGFTPVSPKKLVLADDPTENAMMAFVKTPKNLEELKQLISYRNDCTRPKEGTRATWMEWGNVRFSNQYAEFVQNHHAHAFDFVGHLRQHWQYFYHYVNESMKDEKVNLVDLVLSDNMAMNLFILSSTAVQCGTSAMTMWPSRAIAQWMYGNQWRDVTNLSDLEKFEAQVEKEYSGFIEHTPFYMYDYVGKIKDMWKTVWNSSEPFHVKATSALKSVSNSIGFLGKAAVSAPIKRYYTSEANIEPDAIKVLIKDPHNAIDSISQRWESEKDAVHHANHKIEVLYSTPDGYKLVSMPRYRPFTQICGYMAEAPGLQLLEIGSQSEVSVDVLMEKGITPDVPGARVVYDMEKLHDEMQRHYVTYQVQVAALQTFQKIVGKDNIEYVHE